LPSWRSRCLVHVRYRSEVAGGGGSGHLEHLVLRDRDSGETELVPATGLFVLIGAEPFTAWLPDTVARDRWGFILTGPDTGRNWPLERAPFMLETTSLGVFAAGDVRHGSVKRVASAVGEGSIAIRLVHEYLALAPPGAKVKTRPHVKRLKRPLPRCMMTGSQPEPRRLLPCRLSARLLLGRSYGQFGRRFRV
jgi:hypothetical protein